MSTVVDLAAGSRDAGEGRGDGERDADENAGGGAATDPFAGGHIEVEESAVRAVSPSAWLGGVRRRIDDLATRLTYGT